MSDAKQRGPGSWSSLVQVFWNPGQVMAAQAEQPAILPPYLLAMVVGAAVSVVVTLGTWDIMAPVVMKQMQSQGANTLPMSEETFKWFTLGSAAVGALVAPWVTGLITALLLMLAGLLRGGAEGFKKYLAVAGYAALPGMIAALLRIPLSLAATGMEQLQRVSFGPLILFPQASPTLMGMLQVFDMFKLWGWVLAIIGFAAVHRISARKAWLAGAILLLVQVGWGAVQGSMAGAFTPKM